MIKVIPYKNGHVDLLDPTTIFTGDEQVLEYIDVMDNAEGCKLHSLIYQDKVIAINGIMEKWRGLAEVFSFSSSKIKDCPVAFHKKSLEMLDFYIKEMKLHRVQAPVRVAFEEGHRWVKGLGMKYESKIYAYGPDREDYNMYARIM